MHQRKRGKSGVTATSGHTTHSTSNAMNDDDFDDIEVSNASMELVNSLLESTTEEEGKAKRRPGSRPGKRPNLHRGFDEVAARLQRQYLGSDPVYDAEMFRRRYRVSRDIYSRVHDAIVGHDSYFVQKSNCCGKHGIASHVKITAALRILAYGLPPDAIDDYLCMSSTTARETLRRFCCAVIDTLGPEYLRSATTAEIKKMLRESKKRGTPGLLGSIDCCKWVWKNCPTAWHGQFKGKEKAATVTLEAICDRSLWIWHAFFGMPGSMNDINVVEASTIMSKIAEGSFPPPCEYLICGVRRNKPYWFCDGIYPKAPFFICSVCEPTSKKEKLFASVQEAIRKDIERAFGVLQAKWNIISRPSKFMTVDIMADVMRCVIILHNMCVEERETFGLNIDEDDEMDEVIVGGGVPPMWGGLVRSHGSAEVSASSGSVGALCEARAFMEDGAEHVKMKTLLMDHLWERHGEE